MADLYYRTGAEQPFLDKIRSQTLWLRTRWLICIILETQESFKMELNYVGVLLLWVSKTPLNLYITFLLMYSAFKQLVGPFTALCC